MNASTDAADQLFALQFALEVKMRADMNEFELRTGMSVHSIKIFRSDPVDGRRHVAAIEVAAQLR